MQTHNALDKNFQGSTALEPIRMSAKDHAISEARPPSSLKRAHHDEHPSTTEASNGSQDPRSLYKRHKTADWPLKNSVALDVHNTASNTRAPAKSPPSQRKRKGKKISRPSKFKEGSLNDKPSKEPPLSYISAEEAMEEYSRMQGAGDGLNLPFEVGIESTKASGMFRFGRVIANALNPVSVWQGINGIWKEKEQHVPEKADKPEDRSVEINKAYAALKDGGFQGMKTTNIQRNDIETSRISSEDRQNSKRNTFRDSAIDMEDGHAAYSSQDIKRNSHLTVPVVREDKRSVSPLSESSSKRRSFTHLRTPSFHDLKKVKSHIQLPSTQRRASAAPLVPAKNTTVSTDAEPLDAATGLRRQPSKKDIARHNKLNKRVSDLETKLEAARQELQQSLLDAPPVPELPRSVGRKQFVPGALDSLPSERLLAKHVKDEGADSSRVSSYELRKSVSNDRHLTTNATPASGPQSWLDIKPEQSGRRSSARFSASNNKVAHRKATVVEDPIALSSAGVKKRPLPSRTPRNSPNHIREDVPSLPAPGFIFDLATVNQADLLSMRAIPSDQLPFGEAGDDIRNFRKAYPSITDKQVAEYTAMIAIKSKGKIDHVSVQHANRPPSPFLGRPQAVSPIKTRSRAQKRGISPPPPSLASAKKTKEVKGTKVDEDDSSPVLGHKNADAGKKALRSNKQGGNAVKAQVSKPLPGIQKEDFEWDEDIF